MMHLMMMMEHYNEMEKCGSTLVWINNNNNNNYDDDNNDDDGGEKRMIEAGAGIDVRSGMTEEALLPHWLQTNNHFFDHRYVIWVPMMINGFEECSSYKVNGHQRNDTSKDISEDLNINIGGSFARLASNKRSLL